MSDNIKPTVQEKTAWAKVSQEFNDWWNSDYSDESNPFRINSAAYWAWAGWSEAVRLNAQAQQPLTDEKEALTLLDAENARLMKLVLAYRGQRNPHHLAEKISDMMTYAGCSLTEYQQSVLAAGLRALLETREDELESNG